MIDIILTLQSILPAPNFIGCIEYEKPLLNTDGFGTGKFRTISIEELQIQYEDLQWEDERPKPDWETLVNTWPVIESRLNPLATITTAIKTLPIQKRTNTEWGSLLTQSLLAIHNDDIEALGYLLNNFQTEDTEYIDIINTAKTLFSI
jgi:hypothetical protein